MQINDYYEVCRYCGNEVYIPQGSTQGVCDGCGSMIERIPYDGRKDSWDPEPYSDPGARQGSRGGNGQNGGRKPPLWLPIVIVSVTILMMLAAALVLFWPFWEKEDDVPETPSPQVQEDGESPSLTELPFSMEIPPLATPQPTAMPVPTMTPQPTAMPVPTMTPQPTAMPVPTMTPQPTAMPVPTMTPPPTAMPVPTMTPPPTAMPTPIPEAPAAPKGITFTAFLGQPRLPQLIPAGASASSTLFANGHDYPATAVIDSNHNNSWQEGVPGDGIGQTITVFLNGNQWLSAVSFRIGYAANVQWYYNNNRPKDVRVYFSDGRSVEFSFSDTMEYQTICFDEPVNTNTITMEILSVYYGGMHDRMQDTCMSEIVAYGQ